MTVIPREVPKGYSAGLKRFLTSTGLNTFGDVISTIAIPVIAFQLLEASTFAVAALVAAEQAAWLLVGLPAGVWVDRWSRRAVLVWGGLSRGLLLFLIPVAWLTNTLSLQLLFVVAVLTGLIAVFTTIAGGAYLPSIVEKDGLLLANSRLSVVNTATDTAGQVAAGFVIQLIRAPAAIAIEAVSAIAAALIIATTKEGARVPLDEDSPKEFWPQLRAGIRYTLGHPTYRTILATNVTWNVAMAGQFAIAVPFLIDAVGVSEGIIGIAFAVGGIGGLVGALLVSPLSVRFGSGTVWRVALSFGPIAGLLVPTASLLPGFSGAILFGLGSAFLGAAIAAASVITGAARQSICPPEMLGRLAAVSQFISWGIIPVGALIFGALAALLGLEVGMWLVAVTFFACPVTARLSPLWKSKQLEVDLG